MKTLIDLFKSFKEKGNKTAIVYRTGVRRFVFSYIQIYTQSLRFASWLKSKGIKNGDNILIWAPNSPWWAVSYFGSIISGAVVVPVDFASGFERAEKIAKLTNAKLIIQSQYKFDSFKGENAVNIEDVEYLIAELKPTEEFAKVEELDLALLVYTSGTTGDPKGVMLTHKNLISNVVNVLKHIKVSTPHNFLSVLPLSHMFEQVCGLYCPLYLGGHIIYIRTLKPTAIMEAFEEEDVYVGVMVPRLLQLLKTSIEREFENKKIKPLLKALAFIVRKKFGKNFKFFVSGGAPLDVVTGEFWKSLGFKVVEGYGLTETSPILTANTLDKQIFGTVGTPIPGVEIKLEGEEIVAKGDNVFSGYYENPEATRKTFTEDGWFKTGDLGEYTKDGFLKIKGRSKDIIVTGAGINVYPSDVEKALAIVSGVKECCVLGVDKGNGDEVYATFILDENCKLKPEEIVQKANSVLDSEQHITSYSLWPYAEFPKTTTLKIQKFLVKKEIVNKNADHPEEISKDKLINLIERVTGKPASIIKEETVIVRDLGLTSIARLELVNLIELEYRMDLDDNMIKQNTSVSELRKIIVNREKFKIKNHLMLWPNKTLAMFVRSITDKLILFPIFRYYVKLTVEGDEVLKDLKSPVIFIANHLSFGDHTCIYVALKGRWHTHTATASWEEFFFPMNSTLGKRIERRIFFYVGSIMLNLFPLSQVKGFRDTVKFMGTLADHDINILIFPEGTRSKDGKMLPFQLGISVIVKELKVPVVPIHIEGIDKVLHPNMTWPKRGSAKVRFGKPLMFTNETQDEIVSKCRRAIEDLRG